MYAEDFNISAKNIKIDKDKQTTVFESDVFIEDDKKNFIKSDYAQYNKIKEFFILKGNIVIKDFGGNEFQSENATYDKKMVYIKLKDFQKSFHQKGTLFLQRI